MLQNQITVIHKVQVSKTTQETNNQRDNLKKRKLCSLWGGACGYSVQYQIMRLNGMRVLLEKISELPVFAKTEKQIYLINVASS